MPSWVLVAASEWQDWAAARSCHVPTAALGWPAQAPARSHSRGDKCGLHHAGCESPHLQGLMLGLDLLQGLQLGSQLVDGLFHALQVLFSLLPVAMPHDQPTSKACRLAHARCAHTTPPSSQRQLPQLRSKVMALCNKPSQHTGLVSHTAVQYSAAVGWSNAVTGRAKMPCRSPACQILLYGCFCNHTAAACPEHAQSQSSAQHCSELRAYQTDNMQHAWAGGVHQTPRCQQG